MDPNFVQNIERAFMSTNSDHRVSLLSVDELSRTLMSLGVPLSVESSLVFQKTLSQNADGYTCLDEFKNDVQKEQVAAISSYSDAWAKVLVFFYSLLPLSQHSPPVIIKFKVLSYATSQEGTNFQSLFKVLEKGMLFMFIFLNVI